MKSDREFLDGIYEKAKRYEEQRPVEIKQRRNVLKPVLVSGLSLAACFALIVAANLNNGNNKPIERKDTRGIPSPAVFQMDLPIPDEEVAVSGILSFVDKREKKLGLKDVVLYEGEGSALGEEMSLSYEELQYEGELKEGERVLLYAVYIEGSYQLRDEASIYRYIEDKDEYQIYENFNGEILDTEIFLKE